MKPKLQHSKGRILVLRSTIAMIFIACFVVSCDLSTLMSTPVFLRTTDIPNWGSTALSPESGENMPRTLNCALVPTTSPVQGGVSWQGLTVGVSTFEDVAKTLTTEGTNYGWNTDTGSMFFSRSKPSRLDVDACFVGETLFALHILARSDPKMIFSELVKNYGNPDRVTWANYITERSLIWSEKGQLIVADVNIDIVDDKVVTAGTVWYIILFPPIPRCQLEESWIFQSLSKSVTPYKGDVAIITTEAEDPWQMEKGLSDCPKK